MELQLLAYAVLWGIVGCCSIAVRRSLREVIAIGDTTRRLEPMRRLPRVSFREFSSGRTVLTRGIIGEDFTVFVVGPISNDSPKYARDLALSFRILKERAEGRMCLLCLGSDEECRKHVAILGSLLTGSQVLQDVNGAASQRLKLERTPAALVCNASGRILKTGYMGQ